MAADRTGTSRAAARRSPARAALAAALAPFLLWSIPGAGGALAVPASEQASESGADLSAGLERVRGLIAEGRYAEAEARARALLPEAEAAQGPRSLETAGVLDVLVESLWRGGKSKEPETRELARRAVAIKEERLGPDEVGAAVSLNNLGIVCSDAGDYPAAQAAYERALAIREKAHGPDHPEVARVLNNLGVVSFHRGEYAAARALHERALSIREKSLGPEHPDLAPTLANLAGVFRGLGDYARARPLYERALAVRTKALGESHPYVAMGLNDLASLLAAMGDDSEARELYERALSIAEKSFGPGHPAPARILSGLGGVLLDGGDHAGARRHFERALAIREATHDPDHPDLAVSLADLAAAVRAGGDLAGAESLYERSIPIWERTVGPGHPALAGALHELGGLHEEKGDLVRAEALYARALAIREEALGAGHPAVAESLARLAALRLRTGRPDRALEEALRAEEIARQHLRLTLRVLPERQALRYVEVASRGLDVGLALVARDPDRRRIRLLWDALIRSRALVLDEMAARRRAVGQAADAEIRGLARSLLSARARLANLTVRSLEGVDPRLYRRLLEDARREKEAAERVLAERSAPFREELDRGRAGLDEVAAALPPGSALVAFVRYRPPRVEAVGSGPPVPRYLAFVLPSRDSGPVAVPLGPAAGIEDQVAQWRHEIGSLSGRIGRSGPTAERRYRMVAAEIRRRVWDPIEPHCRTAGLVLLVPDGELSLLSWAALPSGTTDYLLGTAPPMHYLSTERDAVSPAVTRGAPAGLLALGDPDFGPLPARAGARMSAEAEAPCGDFGSLRFAPLPGSRAEAEMVASLWRSAPDRPAARASASLLVGPEASEERIKEEAPRHSVLHLATHGFFLGDRCPAGSAMGPRGRPGPDAASWPMGGSPLLLSGLALAGANRRGGRSPADDRHDDGILTAEEVASLDLGGVSWVVLSACGSGLGEARAGEGVLGLRRAFQVAGARSLITSLWEVDDASARSWIGALYRRHLRGATTAEAARQASLDVLAGRRRAGLSTHPFFWGAFVAAGDWR